jgi:hypothetical protein
VKGQLIKMSKMFSFEEFSNLYNAAKGEPEFEICFIGKIKTYMIIKYDDHVSFQRCGVNDGSGEYDYSSLKELYQIKSVDGICLKDKWDTIDTIIADGMYDLSISEELEDFKKYRDIE